MRKTDSTTRRTVLKITGATAATALVAGCGGNGDDGNGNGNGNGNGDGNGNGNGEAIEPGTEIDLEGNTSEWTGLAPSEIEGESNPTITLTEGEDYTIGWSQGDGANHNIEIVDENDEVVDDHSTEESTEENPDDQWLEVTASTDMAEYVCRPHQGQMRGTIEIV